MVLKLLLFKIGVMLFTCARTHDVMISSKDCLVERR